MSSALRKSLREFAAEHVGSDFTIQDKSRSFGRRSITWKLEIHGGPSLYLKRHDEYRLFETEKLVYAEWLPRLSTGENWQNSKLLADSEELGALLLTEVPGTIFGESDTSREDAIAMYGIAGAVAAEIHRIEVDPSAAGPPRLYDPENISQTIDRVTPYVDQSTVLWAESILLDETAIDGLDPVPTHSDFSPRNWLIDRSSGSISFGLIDWERARAGYWLEDVQRMVYDDWQREPDFRQSFFEGYGRFPDAREERQIRLICLVNALATIQWATDRDDISFASFGRSTLDTIKRELS